MKHLLRCILFALTIALTSTAHAGLLLFLDVTNSGDPAFSQNINGSTSYAVSWNQPEMHNWGVDIKHIYIPADIGVTNWTVTVWRGTQTTVDELMGSASLSLPSHQTLDLTIDATDVLARTHTVAGLYFMHVQQSQSGTPTSAGWIDGDYTFGSTSQGGLAPVDDYTGTGGVLLANGMRGFSYSVHGETPEPSSYFLLAAGLCSLGLYRVRRKAKA